MLLLDMLYEARYDLARAHDEVELVDVLKLAVDLKVLLDPSSLYQSFDFEQTRKM
jgi:hypothetical protein